MYSQKVWYHFVSERGGDALVSLSWTMGSKDQTSEKLLVNYRNLVVNFPIRKNVLNEAGNIITDLLHKEIETQNRCSLMIQHLSM